MAASQPEKVLTPRQATSIAFAESLEEKVEQWREAERKRCEQYPELQALFEKHERKAAQHKEVYAHKLGEIMRAQPPTPLVGAPEAGLLQQYRQQMAAPGSPGFHKVATLRSWHEQRANSAQEEAPGSALGSPGGRFASELAWDASLSVDPPPPPVVQTFSQEVALCLTGVAAAVMWMATKATLDEEMRVIEYELEHQLECGADDDHLDLLRKRLAVRQELRSLAYDLPEKRADLKREEEQLEAERSGRGQARAKQELEEAKEALTQARKSLGNAERSITGLKRRLEVTLPEEAAALQSKLESCQGSIRVIARIRPGAGGSGQGTEECLQVEDNSVILQGEKWTYDCVFYKEASQADVFAEVRTNVTDIFNGKNAVIFAYGQTGSGKTHTLVGTKDMPGVARRMMREVFDFRDKKVGRLKAHRWPIRCSMVELYIDDFCDLLVERGARKLDRVDKEGKVAKPQVHEGKERRLREITGALLRCVNQGLMVVYFAKLTKYLVQRQKERKDAAEHAAMIESQLEGSGFLQTAMAETFRFASFNERQPLLWQPTELDADTPEELERHFAQGDGQRHTRGTKMNAASSRSHLIFTIIVRNPRGGEGRLALIDLAGSERLAKSQVEGQGQKEAVAINKSLTALGNVIEKLSQVGRTVVPYRDHALTQMLQPWLTGTSKVTMFMNVSPLLSNKNETSGTLRFAQRAKAAKLQNVAQAAPLRREIRILQREEKEKEAELLRWIDQLPHLSHAVGHAEERQKFAQEQVANARDRRERLEAAVKQLQKVEKMMAERLKELSRLERPPRYVVESMPPVFELQRCYLELEQVSESKLAPRTWNMAASVQMFSPMQPHSFTQHSFA